jgi:predicted nucleic acid-binding Zn ribbon protein
MTTYVYETIPVKPGEKPQYFEIKQSMKDAALTKHPETGEPIRRVVLGGFGVLSSGKSGGEAPASGSSCCGPGCGCH